jgi:histidinol-phosphate aminotransferase
VISAGSGQILEVLALTYLSKGGGEVIEAEIGYQDIARTAQMYNDRMNIPTNVINVPMKNHRHDLDAMLKAITPRTTMVVITNPNNPTGTLLSYEEIERFVNAAPKHVLIVIDEAYIHFVRDPNYKTSISLAASHDNVITVRTFSKVYGMPAMRLGYAVCSADIQNLMRFYMNGSANLLAQVAGTASAQDRDHYERSRQVVFHFRDRCYEAFDKMGLEYIPSESNFFMVNIGKNARPVIRDLMQRRVMVSARGGDKMPTWIRVSSGTEKETEVFLNELKDILSSAS